MEKSLKGIFIMINWISIVIVIFFLMSYFSEEYNPIMLGLVMLPVIFLITEIIIGIMYIPIIIYDYFKPQISETNHTLNDEPPSYDSLQK
jgi:uncharacterized membrane protein